MVEASNGLVGEGHLVSRHREVVDRSLVATDALQEEQWIRWGMLGQRLGEHQQAEAFPPEDGRKGNPREGVVAVVVCQRTVVVVDKGAVGWASQGAETRGVSVRPPVANPLFGLKTESRQVVAALVRLGQPQQPCFLVYD